MIERNERGAVRVTLHNNRRPTWYSGLGLSPLVVVLLVGSSQAFT